MQPMNMKRAITMRLMVLCAARDMSMHELAKKSQIPPESLYSILGEKSQNPSILSILKLCTGLGVTLREFFDCDVFNNLEQEIR